MIVTICPFCESVSNHQTPMDKNDDVPLTGDASICARCGAVAIFDFTAPTNVRRPMEEEEAHIAKCPEVSEARAIIVSRTLQ